MNMFLHSFNSIGIGKTQLCFISQAGFVLRSSAGTTIGIDLYLSDCVDLMGLKDFRLRLLCLTK